MKPVILRHLYHYMGQTHIRSCPEHIKIRERTFRRVDVHLFESDLTTFCRSGSTSVGSGRSKDKWLSVNIYVHT